MVEIEIGGANRQRLIDVALMGKGTVGGDRYGRFFVVYWYLV